MPECLKSIPKQAILKRKRENPISNFGLSRVTMKVQMSPSTKGPWRWHRKISYISANGPLKDEYESKGKYKKAPSVTCSKRTKWRDSLSGFASFECLAIFIFIFILIWISSTIADLLYLKSSFIYIYIMLMFYLSLLYAFLFIFYMLCHFCDT